MKKKSFYFEDYTESGLNDSNNNSNIIKISLNKVTFLSFIFFSLILIFSIKIIYLSLSPEKIIYTTNVKENFLKNRRDIVDRHGSVLATNVILYDVGVRPGAWRQVAEAQGSDDLHVLPRRMQGVLPVFQFFDPPDRGAHCDNGRS